MVDSALPVDVGASQRTESAPQAGRDERTPALLSGQGRDHSALVPNDFPGKRVVVVSPHSDDAVLSLGAAIAAWARRGAEVEVLTVFALDPGSHAPAGGWDASRRLRH